MSETNEFDAYALRQIVEQGGGDWVGVQEGFEDIEGLVLFNDLNSRHGSTMALKISKVTVKSVKSKIRAKRREMRGQ